jgi:hypothetical protein
MSSFPGCEQHSLWKFYHSTAKQLLLKMLSDGVSALYNNYRNDVALTRKTIQTQLESARWPAYSEVKAAQ